MEFGIFTLQPSKNENAFISWFLLIFPQQLRTLLALFYLEKFVFILMNHWHMKWAPVYATQKKIKLKRFCYSKFNDTNILIEKLVKPNASLKCLFINWTGAEHLNFVGGKRFKHSALDVVFGFECEWVFET